jgi:hypothetical protein
MLIFNSVYMLNSAHFSFFFFVFAYFQTITISEKMQEREKRKTKKEKLFFCNLFFAFAFLHAMMFLQRSTSKDIFLNASEI